MKSFGCYDWKGMKCLRISRRLPYSSGISLLAPMLLFHGYAALKGRALAVRCAVVDGNEDAIIRLVGGLLAEDKLTSV